MFDDLEPTKRNSAEITLGCDLSTFSLSDLDERIKALQVEIERIQVERNKKVSHMNAANNFFKS